MASDLTYDAAVALLEEIKRHMSLLTFNPDAHLMGRALCGAGLARALALTDGISILESNGRADVSGVLVRTTLEVHHVALYALLGGDEGVRELARDHRFWTEPLARKNFEGETRDQLVELIQLWADKPQKLALSDLGKRLEPLLTEAVGEDQNLQVWYDLVFRGESTFNVHGLGQFTRYLDLEPNPWQLRRNPGPVAPHGSFVVATVLTANIAQHLFHAHGIGTRVLEDRLNALIGSTASTPSS